MDRLLTMQTFTKVVQCSSLTAAGDEMGISRALVSRHITDLERHFGVRLLHRTTRSVTPTEAGRHYFEFCSRIFSEMRSEEELITKLKKNVEGKLSIVAPKWVGNLDIAAAIIEFCKVTPKVNIQLTLGGITAKTHEFLERGFDICIQDKQIRDSEVRVKKIADVSFALLAAPEYLAQHGTPAHPNDLMSHDCLVQAADLLWRFHDGAESIALKVPSRFGANSYSVLCSAALGGLGIVLLPKSLASEYLRSGELVEILAEFPLESRPLFAAYAPGDDIPRKVRTLLTFLGDWFRRHPLSDPRPPGIVLDMVAKREAQAS